MDRLTALCLLAVSLMLVTYALESRGRVYVPAFTGLCMLGSAYGVLQGEWPFGLVEGVRSLVVRRRWWAAGPRLTSAPVPIRPAERYSHE